VLSENPLLRSGIVLAGANQRKSGTEDGILTALEATGLDLRGTELVTLSACETGVGEVRNGEGVYGLHRAFVIAGAKGELVSLWKVADEETKTLMVAYYQRLAQGSGRSSSLRATQLDMLAQRATAHPYYWASFVYYGDPSPVGQSIAMSSGAGPAVPGVDRGARGCSCEAAGAADCHGSALGSAIVLGMLARQRRRRKLEARA
jgi:hypothetical protein